MNMLVNCIVGKSTPLASMLVLLVSSCIPYLESLMENLCFCPTLLQVFTSKFLQSLSGIFFVLVARFAVIGSGITSTKSMTDVQPGKGIESSETDFFVVYFISSISESDSDDEMFWTGCIEASESPIFTVFRFSFHTSIGSLVVVLAIKFPTFLAILVDAHIWITSGVETPLICFCNLTALLLLSWGGDFLFFFSLEYDLELFCLSSDFIFLLSYDKWEWMFLAFNGILSLEEILYFDSCFDFLNKLTSAIIEGAVDTCKDFLVKDSGELDNILFLFFSSASSFLNNFFFLRALYKFFSFLDIWVKSSVLSNNFWRRAVFVTGGIFEIVPDILLAAVLTANVEMLMLSFISEQLLSEGTKAFEIEELDKYSLLDWDIS